MSKLASIQIITAINPIPGADNIEVVDVLGWKVVVAKKDNFKVGDKVVYIQIDTIVPDTPQFEFLRERKFRVRTIKLRGQLSQGLIVPLANSKAVKESVVEGQDVTDSMGIKKYEKIDNNPTNFEKPRMPKVWYKKYIYLFKYNYLYRAFPSLKRKLRSPFPKNLISITDEERIQNIPNVLEQYKGKLFYTSYKLDGSSITIIHNKVMGKSKFRICSRRFELHDKKNDWYRVFIETRFDQHILNLTKYFKTNDIIVQGECIGKFNGNHHGLTKDEIRLFNIQVNGKRLPPEEFYNVTHTLLIPNCPLYKCFTLNYSMEEILKISQIKDLINPKVEAEGLVWRDKEGTISFKVINNKYLLKEQ